MCAALAQPLPPPKISPRSDSDPDVSANVALPSELGGHLRLHNVTLGRDQGGSYGPERGDRGSSRLCLCPQEALGKSPPARLSRCAQHPAAPSWAECQKSRVSGGPDRFNRDQAKTHLFLSPSQCPG